jgi:GTPase-activating protein that regulates ARFs (ADP-ribosylation factors), involved in ARF-mediated vesicular transport
MIDIEPPSIQTSYLGGEETIMIEVTPRASEEEKQAKLRKRVKKLLKRETNKLCIECSKPNPRWAALLCVPSVHGGSETQFSRTFLIGGFCCLECSGAHRRLGTHLSFVRSIDLDTLKEHEVEALESGGNQIVNSIFEGHLLDGSEKLDPSSCQKARETFIRNKYEKKKYLDIKTLAQFRLTMMHGDCNPHELTSPLSFTSSPSSADESRAVSPQQLQIFTSSPRTLALIEKYMNPKPKKKGLNKMKFSFKRFSRKRRFKGDIRNLQGVVSVNPNLNMIETRSDYCPSPASDIDGDFGSVTSTKSSISTVIRRKFIRGKGLLTPRMKDYSMGKKTPKSKAKSTPRRRKFFGKKHGIKLSDYPAEELENFDTKKDIFSPSPASSDSSRRSRLTHLLRTPKLANTENKTLTSNQNANQNSTEYFFADIRELKVVNESDSTDTADEDAVDQKEDIKALRAWSKKFDNVMAKVFKQRRAQKKMDEVTLLP